MDTRINPSGDQRHWNIAQSMTIWRCQFQDRCRRTARQLRLRISNHRTIKDLPDSVWSSSIRGCTECQPRPPRSASEIAIRDRSNTRRNWGHNWGHNSFFSGCNYCPRAQSKCFLGILRVFRRCRAGCLADHFWLFIGHGDPFTSSGLLHWGHIEGMLWMV